MGPNGYPLAENELIQVQTEERILNPNVPDMIDGKAESLFPPHTIDAVMRDKTRTYTVPAVVSVENPESGRSTELWLVRSTLKPNITNMGYSVTYGMVDGKRQMISGSTYALVDPTNLRVGKDGVVESGFFPIGGEHPETIGRGAQSSSDVVMRSNNHLGSNISRSHLEAQVIRGDRVLVTNLGSKYQTSVIAVGEAKRPGPMGRLARWAGRIGLGPRR